MLLIIGLISLLLSFLYSLLVWKLILSWNNLPVQSNISANSTPVTIIVPARNEEHNILNTLKAVYLQDYPTDFLELIIVDDHSTDATVQLLSEVFPQCKIVKLNASMEGKKQAVLSGVQHATYDIIINLDADCIPVSNQWLKTIVSSLIKSEHIAVTAPVIYTSNGSIWQNMEATENLAMMFITGAAYSAKWFQMANGGNLAFYKKEFLMLNPYRDNMHLGSGDDMFLFEKIETAFPGKTGFVKHNQAVVFTQPQENLKGYVAQRIRWGTKNKSLKSIKLKLVLGFIYIENSFLLFSFCLLLFSSGLTLLLLLTAMVLKFLFDFMLLKKSAEYFLQTKVLQSYIASMILYPLMLFITGFLSLFKKTYYWKQRKME